MCQNDRWSVNDIILFFRIPVEMENVSIKPSMVPKPMSVSVLVIIMENLVTDFFDKVKFLFKINLILK